MAKAKRKKQSVKPLTAKIKRFCQEYLLDLNATQAYRRVYKNVKSDNVAAVQAHKLLRNAKVQTLISELQKKEAAKFEVTREEIIRQYYRFAFQDIRKYYNEDGSLKPIHKLDDDAAAALAGVEVDELFAGVGENRVKIGETKKIKRWDAPKALDGLVRMLGFEAPKKFEHEVSKGFIEFLKAASTK